jgi:hypothetical protein
LRSSLTTILLLFIYFYKIRRILIIRGLSRGAKQELVAYSLSAQLLAGARRGFHAVYGCAGYGGLNITFALHAKAWYEQLTNAKAMEQWSKKLVRCRVWIAARVRAC